MPFTNNKGVCRQSFVRPIPLALGISAQAVLQDLRAQLPWGNVGHSTGGCLVWLGSKPPAGALLGGRIMQNLCFSLPVLHARHVACHLLTLLLEIVLDIFGDPVVHWLR